MRVNRRRLKPELQHQPVAPGVGSGWLTELTRPGLSNLAPVGAVALERLVDCSNRQPLRNRKPICRDRYYVSGGWSDG